MLQNDTLKIRKHSKEVTHCNNTYNIIVSKVIYCEILMSTKQAINDKLQGSVATYLRCDGAVNNQIKKVYCGVCE